MNEYLMEIMNDETIYDEEELYAMASRKIAKKHRTYFDSQILMCNTLEDWIYTDNF